MSAETVPMPGASPSGSTLRSARVCGFLRDAFAWNIVTAVISRRPVRPLGDEGRRPLPVAWAFVLEPIDANRTRLLARASGDYDRPAVWLLLQLVWRPMHFAMERKQLLNLRRRSEGAVTNGARATRATRDERTGGGSDDS